MKAIEQYFPVVLIMLYKVVLTATEQYFPVVLFIMLHNPGRFNGASSVSYPQMKVTEQCFPVELF